MSTSSELLKRLVSIYKGENIRYLQLREVTLAQWLLESARATSDLATKHYNFGGLKWRSEMSPFATEVMYTASDGPNAYCKFATIESFISGYWAFLNRSPYSGWEEHVDSGEEFMQFIGPIYCPNDGYVGKVLSLIPDAAQLLSESSTTPVPQPSNFTKIGTIVIDPGHGGTQRLSGSSPNNAISHTGVKEKKLTLDFALILQELIHGNTPEGRWIDIVLTRSTDMNLEGSKRAGKAGESNADLFLSIHFNATNGSVRGTETYYRAAANNNQNLQADIDFATKVQSALIAGMKEIDPGAKDRGVKPDTDSGPGAIGVLNDVSLGNSSRQQKCRACLTELEFIDVPAVDKLLISGDNAISNRRSVMNKLAIAIVEYMIQISG
jgi:N-acetylmuramoyl-L-alanine amidase